MFSTPVKQVKGMERVSRNHPLAVMFGDLIHDQVARHVTSAGDPSVERYLTSLLLNFLHMDQLFAIKDDAGERVESVIEMVAEGDVRLKADSFEREREVHKHIGDYILFWSGVYPPFLRKLRVWNGAELVCDYTSQGKQSYQLVSTFDHSPYDQVAPTFGKLSEGFDDFTFVLKQVSEQVQLYVA
ncbi:MAG: hypothetical protein KDC26_05650 [Armatimonadetes bacterium]|nr:hypothetical protein [Armatimonadota bacterium]